VKLKAQIVELKAFLLNRNPNQHRVFSDSQIHRAEVKLDLTRKAATTTADKAFLPHNLNLRHMYFNCNYPLGIADISAEDMIDSDKAVFFLEMTNRDYGKTVRGCRCDEQGVYNKGSEKVNVLIGISGDPNNPMRWIDQWTGEGTTLVIYYRFICRVCDDLDQNFPGRSFCFTMDNLNSHKNPIILTEIVRRGHKYIFRAPYWAVDGAVEYVFNTMHTLLLMHYNELSTIDDLKNKLNQIFGNIPSFLPYFHHVGMV